MSNLEYSRLYDLIDARDGMLVSQIYRFIPESKRPAYSTFLRNLYRVKGLRYKQVLSQSRAHFVTTRHTITETRMRLMIMLAE
jgi:glutathionyl-hydroquinone reductase